MSAADLEILKADKSALLEALKAAGARVNGNHAHIGCPWHGEDKTGSLSVSEKDGAWLWRCHVCDGGGSIVDVVARAEKLDSKEATRRALELYGNKPARPLASKAPSRPAVTFADLDAAAAHYERQTGGKCTRRDIYKGLDGAPRMVVFRLDAKDGKTFRPCHWTGEAWQEGDPPGKLPLFNLDKLAADKAAPVVVCEGEKCAAALADFGILGTTSAHGAKSASKTDWLALAGRNVTIWRDFDKPGLDYQRDVLKILSTLEPPPVMRLIDPAGLNLAESEDVADYVQALQTDGKEAPEVASSLQAVVASAKPAPPVWLGGVDLAAHVAAVQLKAACTFQKVEYVKTGYPLLDRALGGGWALGESTSLFAPSSMGKSAVMVNLALAVARQATPAAVLSLEMRDADIWRLATGITGGIPRNHIRHLTMTALETERFAQAIQKLSALPLAVIDRRAFPLDPEHPEAPTMQAISAVMQDGVKHCGWRVVFLDYLAKVGPFDGEDLRRMARLTNWIFDTAQRSGLHIVALAQANKSCFGRKEKGTDKRTIELQDSKGGVEVVADLDNCIGLIRHDWNTGKPVDPVAMKAVVLKARQGPGGTAPLIFCKSTGEIHENQNGENEDDA